MEGGRSPIVMLRGFSGGGRGGREVLLVGDRVTFFEGLGGGSGGPRS